MTQRLSEVSRGLQADIRGINRELMEKALQMRCLAYLSNAKAGLLTQTLYEVDRARRQLHGSVRRLSEEQAVIQRQKAELEASTQEMRSFSYAVSHDLRAPLRAINGYAHVLRSDKAGQLDAEGHEFLGRIVAASERMSVLIEGMLELARLSQKPMQTAEIDLSALAETILQELRSVEPQRRVRWHIEPGLRAHGDRTLVYSLMQNLIGNAWKYTRRQPEAEIGFESEREPGGGIGYVVRDNGAGFDSARARKLFVPFQRFHDEKDFEGLGIGLATVARIVDRHGGQLRADSRPGQGARFHFTLGPP